MNKLHINSLEKLQVDQKAFNKVGHRSSVKATATISNYFSS